MHIARPLRLAATWACLFALTALAANAQTFPSRQVRIIDGFTPGGATDVLARTVAEKLTTSLGQPVLVESRPGAGSNIGATAVAKAAPDGYTMFVGSVGTLATSRSLYPKLQYDVLKDLTPVTRVGTGMYVFVANPSLPIKSIQDLVALAKSTPGQINYASSGPGSSTQLCVELLRGRAGMALTQIVYKGAGDFITAIMRGEVAFGCISVTAVKGQIDAGLLKALAVTGTRRAAALPGVPTVAESGYPGFNMALTVGFFAPAGTPRDVIERLNGDVRKALDLPDVRENFARQGIEASSSTPEELGGLLAGEVTQWAEVIRAAGIRME